MKCTDTLPTEELMNKAQAGLRKTGRQVADYCLMSGMIETHRTNNRQEDIYELFEIMDRPPFRAYIGRTNGRHLRIETAD